MSLETFNYAQPRIDQTIAKRFKEEQIFNLNSFNCDFFDNFLYHNLWDVEFSEGAKEIKESLVVYFDIDLTANMTDYYFFMSGCAVVTLEDSINEPVKIRLGDDLNLYRFSIPQGSRKTSLVRLKVEFNGFVKRFKISDLCYFDRKYIGLSSFMLELYHRYQRLPLFYGQSRVIDVREKSFVMSLPNGVDRDAILLYDDELFQINNVDYIEGQSKDTAEVSLVYDERASPKLKTVSKDSLMDVFIPIVLDSHADMRMPVPSINLLMSDFQHNEVDILKLTYHGKGFENVNCTFSIRLVLVFYSNDLVKLTDMVNSFFNLAPDGIHFYHGGIPISINYRYDGMYARPKLEGIKHCYVMTSEMIPVYSFYPSEFHIKTSNLSTNYDSLLKSIVANE